MHRRAPRGGSDPRRRSRFSTPKKFWQRAPGGVKVHGGRRAAVALAPRADPAAHAMKGQHPGEYCLMLEGPYLSVSEAEHALRDPFIEDWVEQTGRFRIHNLNEMMVVPGVPL